MIYYTILCIVDSQQQQASCKISASYHDLMFLPSPSLPFPSLSSLFFRFSDCLRRICCSEMAEAPAFY